MSRSIFPGGMQSVILGVTVQQTAANVGSTSTSGQLIREFSSDRKAAKGDASFTK